MKDWILELCPEIADWQAEMIAEHVEKELERAQSLARSVMADMTSYDAAICAKCKIILGGFMSDLKPNSLYTVGMAMSDFISENNLRWSDTLRAVFEQAEGDYVDEIADAYKQGLEHKTKALTDSEIRKIIDAEVSITAQPLYDAVYMICRAVEAVHGVLEGEDDEL